MLLSDRRYRAAATTAAVSLLGRPINMVLSMAAVAVAVRAIGQEAYGIMVMCLTASAWLGSLDCGLSSSSINRIVKARTGHDDQAVRRVISTAFFFMLAVGILTALAVCCAARFTSLAAFFNRGDSVPLWQVVGCVAVFGLYMAFWFPLQIFERAGVAFQEGWLTVIGQLIGNIVGLVLLGGIIFVAPSLPAVAGAWIVGAIVGALVIAAIALARHGKAFCPSWKLASRAELTALTGTGSWFILIGLAGQIGLQSDPLIAGLAANVVGGGHGAAVAAEVAIPMRLFNVINAFALLAINPLWPAYAEAAAKGDVQWLRKTLRTSMLAALGVSCCAAVPCVVFGQQILRLWVGGQVIVSMSLLVACAFWAVTMTICQSLNVFLSGLGLLRLQFWLNLLFLLLVMPAKVFGLLRFGPTGLVAATAIIYWITQILPYSAFSRQLLTRGISSPRAVPPRMTVA